MTFDFVSSRSKLWTLASAAVGGLAGLGLFLLLLGYASGIEIIQTARVGGIEATQTKISPQLVIDHRAAPLALIERVQRLVSQSVLQKRSV